MNKMLIINDVSTQSIKRIFAKIRCDRQTGCWVWTGCTTQRGYGNVRVNKIGYTTHRFMYAWLVGPIPAGKGRDIPVLDHICGNKLCCNPLHLQLISDTANILKGNGATARNARKTHCRNGHPLPAPINGHRRCMICHRAWNKANYAKNPEKFRAKVRAHRLHISKFR